MQTIIVGHQLDIFGDAAPVLVLVPNPDPFPEPRLWSTSVKEKMVDAVLSLACDSRRGDTMPESILDCALLLRERMHGVRVDTPDYQATLGWIMGYWNGAVPYRYVCAIHAIDPETLQDVIFNHALLKRDLAELQRIRCGTLI
jgi:hypothetical protein